MYASTVGTSRKNKYYSFHSEESLKKKSLLLYSGKEEGRKMTTKKKNCHKQFQLQKKNCKELKKICLLAKNQAPKTDPSNSHCIVFLFG